MESKIKKVFFKIFQSPDVGKGGEKYYSSDFEASLS
jgi:hypothetical protein